MRCVGENSVFVQVHKTLAFVYTNRYHYGVDAVLMDPQTY
jgi:hypothetical protein